MKSDQRLPKLDERQTKLFQVLEEVRAKDFPDLPAELPYDVLRIHMGATPEAPPLSETRKRLTEEARGAGDQRD